MKWPWIASKALDNAFEDAFGDYSEPFEEHIRPQLPAKLRELMVCDLGPGDHGHTGCFFASMAADEIERLRAIPPHPAHVPIVHMPPGNGGVMINTGAGWLLVKPEEER